MPAESADYLYLIRLHTRSESANLLLEILPGLDLSPSGTINSDTHAAQLDFFADEKAEAQALHDRLVIAVDSLTDLLPEAVSIDPPAVLPRENWAESWKRHFHVERISRRIIVRPSWEEAQPQPRDQVITLDPGMSFGTGQHPTTRACLRFLDELAAQYPGSPFIDLGCGSGILSIAAARLDLGPVYAMDYDPDAVAIARENIALNGVADRVTCQVGDVTDWRPPQVAPIVAANILAHILSSHAANIAACISREAPAAIMLAGILTSQYQEVLDCFAVHGLRETRRSTRGEWTSGVLQRV